MPPVNVLVKPASGNCNLRCRYCFDHDEMEKRNKATVGMMDDLTIEAVVREALYYANGSCAFGFQGGEPTLAGRNFFRRVVELEQKYNIDKVTIHNSIIFR